MKEGEQNGLERVLKQCPLIVDQGELDERYQLARAEPWEAGADYYGRCSITTYYCKRGGECLGKARRREYTSCPKYQVSP